MMKFLSFIFTSFVLGQQILLVSSLSQADKGLLLKELILALFLICIFDLIISV